MLLQEQLFSALFGFVIFFSFIAHLSSILKETLSELFISTTAWKCYIQLSSETQI